MPEKKSLAEAASSLDSALENHSSAKQELAEAINTILPHIKALYERGDDIKRFCERVKEAASAANIQIPIAYCEEGGHYYFTNMMVKPNTVADCWECSKEPENS